MARLDAYALTAASTIASSEDFQKHFNNVIEYSKNSAHSTMNDEGIKLASAFTESLDKVSSSQNNYQNALNEMNQASQNLSWSKSNSQHIKRSLNQDFVDWSIDKIGYGKTVEMLESKSHGQDEKMMNEFLDSYISNLRKEDSSNALEGYKEPNQAYEKEKTPSIDYAKELSTLKDNSSTRVQAQGLSKGTTTAQKETLEIRSTLQESDFNRQHGAKKESHSSNHTQIKDSFDEKRAKWRAGHMYDELVGDKCISKQYNTEMSPLWLQE